MEPSSYLDYSKDWITEYPEVDREYMETYPVSFERSVDPRRAVGKKRLNIYVHVPFCARSCSFCTFLHFDRSNAEVDGYVHYLLKEVDLWLGHDLFRNYEVGSIFFGGGTATSLSARQIGDVLSRIRAGVDLAGDAEITVESHPNTVNASYVAQLREFGVNRMTYGVQSFNDQFLGHLGVTQSRERNLKVLHMTREAGFDSVCMDLMFNLPGERLSALEQELDTYLDLGLDGISCYRFVLDHENPIPAEQRASMLALTPSEEEGNEMYQYLVDRLQGSGYIQFAQPDFARPDKVCRYTVAVWRAPQEEQIGFGCGALSYNINNYSFVNSHALAEYKFLLDQRRLPVLLGTAITPDELMHKYFVLGIKCLEVDTRRFEETFGLPYQLLFHEPVRKLERLGLVEEGPGVLRLTARGKLYVDYVCKQFYSHRNQGRFQPDGMVFAEMSALGVPPTREAPLIGLPISCARC